MQRFVSIFIMLCVVLLSGCGYTLQGTRNPLQKMGVQKIYIQSFKNRTYRPGIEQLFTTALVREVEKGKAFTLVNSKSAADAVLMGEITAVDSSIASTTALNTVANKTIQVATEYVATISCMVSLHDLDDKVIFSQNFSGNKHYTGSALIGDAAATVPLTNDSEQRLAYEFLSTQLMSGAYQRLIDLF